MENLTKTQMILLVLLTSFVTSLATAIVTASLVMQAPMPLVQTVNRVIERVTPTPANNQPAQVQPPAPQANPEDKLVGIINSANKAVVSVVATKDMPVVEQFYINPFKDQFPGGLGIIPDIQIPQYRQKGTEKQQVSSGTGFFISKDGLLLTNKHVVEDTQAEYSIVMNDGKKMAAKVLARDPFQDVAILKIEVGTSTPVSFEYLPLGDSDKLKIGQTVIAIGNALGEFNNTVSNGIISGLNRHITAQGALSGPEQLDGLIQTNAAINPGNSGGPLLDFNGKVIGINTAVAQAGENIGFALPINVAKRDVNDAVKFGKIKYPYIGVRYKIVENGLQLAKGEKGEPAVEAGGPAEKAGLTEGDIIVSIGDDKIATQNDLSASLRKRTVGDEVEIKILRPGKEMMVKVTLGERPQQ